MPNEEKNVRPTIVVDVSILDSLAQHDVIFDAVTATPEAAFAVLEVADAFQAAAKAGMFLGDGAIHKIGIDLASLERADECHVRYHWRVDGIQPGAFRVLLNMLRVVHNVAGPFTSVSLRSTSGFGERIGLKTLTQRPLPVRSAQLPFQITLKRNLENSRDPLFRITFQSPIGDGAVDTLVPWFVAWDEIVVRGGYLTTLDDRDPDVSVEESLSGEQTYLAAPDTVEHLFYEFVGAAAAYDAFVNMALKVHHTVQPLALFEVE